jgi:hypothetical protein
MGPDMVSLRIQRLAARVMLLLLSALAFPAETQLPFDSRPLVEVHTLDAIPKEVIALLTSEEVEALQYLRRL